MVRYGTGHEHHWHIKFGDSAMSTTALPINLSSSRLKIIGTFFLAVLSISQQLANEAPVIEKTSLHHDALGELLVRHSSSGNIKAVFGLIRNPAPSKLIQTNPFEAAAFFFQYHDKAFSVDSNTTFKPLKSGRTTTGDLYVQFAQQYKGLKIFGKNAVLKYDDPFTIRYAKFGFDPSIDDVETIPTLSEQGARERANKYIPNGVISGPTELLIYSSESDAKLKQDRLAWKISISGDDRKGNFRNLILLIDAHNGYILHKTSNIQGTGTSFPRRVWKTDDPNPDGICLLDTGKKDKDGKKIYKNSGEVKLDAGKSSNDNHINNVYNQLFWSYNYFNTTFGWQFPRTIEACAYYPYKPAPTDKPPGIAFYWQLTDKQTGDPIDIVHFSEGMATEDIVTHEYTHVIHTETKGGRDFVSAERLPGAVAESLADTFGVFDDKYDWTIGEESTIGRKYPFLGYVRDFEDPTRVNPCLRDPYTGNPVPDARLSRACPDHVNGIYCLPPRTDADETNDYGGVHFNNNILNHAAYEFVQAIGGGINGGLEGKITAQYIYWDTIPCLLRDDGFKDFRDCVVAEAEERQLGQEANFAFMSVGITENMQELCPGSGGGGCPFFFLGEEEETGGIENHNDHTSHATLNKELYNLAYKTFSDSKLGRHYVDTYNNYSDTIFETLLDNKDLFIKSSIVMLANLPGIMELTGASDKPAILTLDSISNIEELVRKIANVTGNSSLVEMVNTELGRFEWNSLEGKTYTEAWNHLVENVKISQ